MMSYKIKIKNLLQINQKCRKTEKSSVANRLEKFAVKFKSGKYTFIFFYSSENVAFSGSRF